MQDPRQSGVAGHEAFNEEGQSELAPMLDPRIQDAIGRSLRAHYDDLLKAPVPDKFLVLLAELEAREIQDSKQTRDVLVAEHNKAEDTGRGY